MTVLKNSNGQAVVETSLALPFLTALFSLILLGAQRVCTFYLVDYWAYQSAMCVAQEIETLRCQRELNKKLNILPFVHVITKKMERKTHSASALIVYQMPLTDKQWIAETVLRLPIDVEDFKRAK